MRWDKNNWRTRYKLCDHDKNIYNEIFTVQAVEQETRIEYNGDQEVEFVICSERSQCAGNSGNDNAIGDSEEPMIFRDDFGDESQDPYLTGDIVSIVNRNVTLEDTILFEDDNITSIIVGGRDVHDTEAHPWLVGLRQDFN